MLRLNRQIRLTKREAEEFKDITGKSSSPTTVAQYNGALERTAQYYHLLAAQENSTDAELLARIAEGELITSEPASEPDEQ